MLWPGPIQCPTTLTSHEETTDPLLADMRNFYKVEKWSKDGLHVEEMLFAGNSLDEAKRILSVSSRSDQGRD
jgi:hypothetical protein